jgi:CubicO group peptidase (beta-lactamase class C family)
VLAGDHQLLQNPKVAAAIKVLDAWIQAKMDDRKQPGLSIGIVCDQDLIWAKGYGLADVAGEVPATPSTVYRIASISKLFTSTAIMQLRDAGKLQLDDPVVKHLSWFKTKETYPDGPTVTIRHLLTHTSGLPREATGVSWNELTFPTREQMIGRLS